MSQGMTRPASGRIQSVQRGHAILDVLAKAPGWRTAAEIAGETGLNRTVVYRLLRTLEGEGMVRSSGSRFSLGEENLRLGTAYLESLGFYRSTLTYAILLAHRFIQDTPWVVSLGVPVGDEVVIVDRLYGRETRLEIILDVGTRLPIALSALGRAILSGRSSQEIESLLGDQLATKIGLQVESVRRTGVAFAVGEIRADMSAMASPIRNQEGRVVAALGVSGTELTPHLTSDSAIVTQLREAAAQISRAMREQAG